MKQGPFPSRAVVLSVPLKRYYEPLRHPSGRHATSRDHRLYAPIASRATKPAQHPGPKRASPLPAPTVRPFRSLYPGSSSRVRLQVLPRFHGLRRELPGSAPPCPLTGLASRGGRIHFTLPTGRLLPPQGLSTLGFDAGRFPPTPPACYPAPWRLPGPDFHRLADASLCPDQTTEGITSEPWAHKQQARNHPLRALTVLHEAFQARTRADARRPVGIVASDA
jgi:hypothetical protein